jgi:hypothetical protein
VAEIKGVDEDIHLVQCEPFCLGSLYKTPLLTPTTDQKRPSFIGEVRARVSCWTLSENATFSA